VIWFESISFQAIKFVDCYGVDHTSVDRSVETMVNSANISVPQVTHLEQKDSHILVSIRLFSFQ